MKMRQILKAVIPAVVFSLSMGLNPGVWAGSSNNNDTVTVKVAPILSISDEVGNFELVFEEETGSAAGAISKNKVVGYKVRANAMPNAALPGALSAKLSVAIPNIDLRAVGGNYVNDGTANNATLVKTEDPVIVGTTVVALANKPASTGVSGQIMQGRYFISWDALAKADLQAGVVGNATLTTTLKDA